MSGVVEVPLRARDGSVRALALVDEEDAERVLERHWFLLDTGYAVASVKGQNTKERLHRFLLGLAPGDPRQVDHRNRDKLDNRRSNLRVATNAQNHQNLVPSGNRGSSSRFRGVSWHARTGRWEAKAMLNGRSHHLGYFAAEQGAAAAAAAFRARHMPFSEADAA